MDETIVTNAQTIENILRIGDGDNSGTEENLGDIFNF